MLVFHMIFCVLVLFLVAIIEPCAGQTFILADLQLRQPKITQCVNDDIYIGAFLNYTECDKARSAGCVASNLNCALSTFFGYTINTNYIFMTPTLMSALDPATADGRVNFTIQYTAGNFAIVNGFVQLWQFSNIDPDTGLDVYFFANREMYINQPQGLPLPDPYTFVDLMMGKYMLVYWDVGGTRYGDGIPETTLPFNLQSVFPDVLDLSVKFVLQQNDFSPPTPCYSVRLNVINVPRGKQNMNVEYPYSKYYGMDYDKYFYFSYKFMGTYTNYNLIPYLDNALSVHNRFFFWEHRSDQGNIINVKTEVIPPTAGYFNCNYCNANVNMTSFCALCASGRMEFYSPACASCSYPSPQFCSFCPGTGLFPPYCNSVSVVPRDSMLYFKIIPMITGSYGEAYGNVVPDPEGDNPIGTFRWNRLSQGRKSRVAIRLGYAGFAPQAYSDFWRMRQSYGDATTIAAKTLDMINVDILPVWQSGAATRMPSAPYQNFNNNLDNSQFAVSAYNYADLDTGPDGTEDHFVSFFYSQHKYLAGYGGSGGMPNAWMDYYNFNDVFHGIGIFNTADNRGNQSAAPNMIPNGDTDVSGNWCNYQNTHSSPYWAWGLQPHSNRCNMFGAQLFRFNISFVEHDNTDDSMCRPTSTAYAQQGEQGGTIKQSAPYTPIIDPQVNTGPSTPIYNIFPFADINIGTEYPNKMFEDPTCDLSCPAGYVFMNTPCNPGTILPPTIPRCCGTRTFYSVPGPGNTCTLGSYYFASGCDIFSPFPSCCQYTTNTLPINVNPCSSGSGRCAQCCALAAKIYMGCPPATEVGYDNMFPPLATICDAVCTGNIYPHDPTFNGGYYVIGETTIEIGASMVRDVAAVMNMQAPSNVSMGTSTYQGAIITYGGLYGVNNGDATNYNNPTISTIAYQPNVPRYYIGTIKDASPGSWPRFYDNYITRQSASNPLNIQSRFPYYQMKASYANRRDFLNNPIQLPVFLVPGILNRLGAIGLPCCIPIYTSPYYTTGNPGSRGENTMFLGLDTHTVSIQYHQSLYSGPASPTPNPLDITSTENEQLIWNTMTFASYSRYKVYPSIIFRTFSNAVPAHGAVSAMIDIEFRVSCPFLAFKQWGDASTPAPCAEGWYITNQRNESIMFAVVQGAGTLPDSDPLAMAAYARGGLVQGPAPMSNQILAGAYDGDVLILQIAYQNTDVLHWVFNLRIESEKPYYLNPSGTCLFQTSDHRTNTPGPLYLVPDTIFVPVPPQQYVLLPMIMKVTIAAPACSYNTPDALIFVKRGTFYAWEDIIALNLASIGASGAPVGVGVNLNFIFYYYKWTMINQSSSGGNLTIEGFSAQFEPYSPPFATLICDVFSCVTPTSVNMIVPDPTYPDPLLRPPRCLNPAINNASCPVNLSDNSTAYSGINQAHFCQGGQYGNALLFTPRLIFQPPYTFVYNVGEIVFNITTEYIDPVLYAQLNNGIFEQQTSFIINQLTAPGGSLFVSMWVQYGLTIQSRLEAPCYDNFVTQGYVLSSFVVSFGSIQRVAGCSRADDCCYFLPLIVSGTSPYNGLPVTLTGTNVPYNQLGNATDLCFGAPECLYEVITSPPYNGDGGICLGLTYTFTVQTPQALVNSRQGPPITLGNTTYYNASSFKYAYRCPTTVSYDMPTAGFAPIGVSTIPGTCANPGTQASFAVAYNDPACTGPISAANPSAQCRRTVYFALAAQNGDPSYPNSATGTPGFSIIKPYPLDGIYTLTYNAGGLFEFPQFFTPSWLPLGTVFPAIPNGYWIAYFWIVPSSSPYPPLMPMNVTDARNMASALFVASLRGVQGLVIARTWLYRPPCPGPPILINFTVTDLAYNGPYLVYFYDPLNQLIYAQNYTCGGQACVSSRPNSTCIDIDPQAALFANPADRQTACDRVMQGTGFSFQARVGTGLLSPGINGGYFVYVNTSVTCASPYVEYMNALLPLTVQVECQPSTCYFGGNGNANSVVFGGTQIPFQNQTVMQGSHFDAWVNLYYYNWTTPQGNQYVSNLLRAPNGNYTLAVTDWNGCTAPVLSCMINSSSASLMIEPAGSVPPNCSGQYGTVEFRVVGGTPPYSLLRITNNTIMVGTGYEILADTSAIPGLPTVYAAVDAYGCQTPQISFTLSGPVAFALTAQVVYYPCSASATGRILATVTPTGLGTTLVWTNLDTGQVVYVGTDSDRYLNNAVAGTYRVTAVAVLYGCVQSVDVQLQTRAPPLISMTRTQVSGFYDRITGSIVSDNGPAYQVSFFGLPTDLPPAQMWMWTFTLVGNVETFVLNNLVGTVTFTMFATDIGNCSSQFFSIGRVITQDDVLNSPTPIPHVKYNQSEALAQAMAERVRHNYKLEVIMLIVVCTITLVVVAMLFYVRPRVNRTGASPRTPLLGSA